MWNLTHQGIVHHFGGESLWCLYRPACWLFDHKVSGIRSYIDIALTPHLHNCALFVADSIQTHIWTLKHLAHTAKPSLLNRLHPHLHPHPHLRATATYRTKIKWWNDAQLRPWMTFSIIPVGLTYIAIWYVGNTHSRLHAGPQPTPTPIIRQK